MESPVATLALLCQSVGKVTGSSRSRRCHGSRAPHRPRRLGPPRAPPLDPRGDARRCGGPSRRGRHAHPRLRSPRRRGHQARADVPLLHQGAAARRDPRPDECALRARAARAGRRPLSGGRGRPRLRAGRAAPPRLSRMGLPCRALRSRPRDLRGPAPARDAHGALAGAGRDLAARPRGRRPRPSGPAARRAAHGRRALVRPRRRPAGRGGRRGGAPAIPRRRPARGTGGCGSSGRGGAMTTWLLLAAAILSEVTATLSLRGALDQPALYAVVVVGYVLTFALLAQTLRRGMGLAVAYGLWGAIGVVLTARASAVLFGEPLSALKISGILLIAAGVAVVELGSQRARRAEAAASADAGAGERPRGGPGPVPVAAAGTVEPPAEEWLAGATSYGSRGEVELLRELEIHALPDEPGDGHDGTEAR